MGDIPLQELPASTEPDWVALADYGFREEELLNVPECQVQLRRQTKQLWESRYHTRMPEHLKAWDDFLENYSSNHKHKKRLVRGGVPPVLRKKAWMLDLNLVSAVEFGYYDKMLGQGRSFDSKAVQTIRKDIHRTFPNHPKFETDTGICALENCLIAYSAHNPILGYCQSMNYIAALLLLFFDEESTFYAMIDIIESKLPNNYYCDDLFGARVDQLVLKTLLKERNARLYTHFEKHSVDLGVVGISWFICLFVNTLPIETCLRVWDAFFHEGDKILFRVGLALLHRNTDALLKLQETHDIYMYLNSLGTDEFDCDELLKLSFSRKLGSLKRSHIQKLRDIHAHELELQGIQREKLRQIYKSKQEQKQTQVEME